MNRVISPLLAVALLVAVPASCVAEMDGHMKEHMKGHTGGSPSEKKDSVKEKALTQESKQGEVTAKVSYENPRGAEPVFKIVLDTHSVDLDKYSFKEMVRLKDSKGKAYLPVVTSESGSGHHREATLVFKGVSGVEDKLTLVAAGVGTAGEWVFEFKP